MNSDLASQIQADAEALIASSGTAITINGTEVSGIVFASASDASVHGASVQSANKRVLVKTSEIDEVSGFTLGVDVVIDSITYALAHIERSGYGWTGLELEA